MSRIENAASDPRQAVRVLRDQELDAVSGGFIVDWFNRDFAIVINRPPSAGSDRMLNFS